MLMPGLEVIEASGHGPVYQTGLVRLTRTGSILLFIDAIPRLDGRLPPRYSRSVAGVRIQTRRVPLRASSSTWPSAMA